MRAPINATAYAVRISPSAPCRGEMGTRVGIAGQTRVKKKAPEGALVSCCYQKLELHQPSDLRQLIHRGIDMVEGIMANPLPIPEIVMCCSLTPRASRLY